MDEKTNEKVINIFKTAHNKEAEKHPHSIKFFAGVNYIRFDEDENGHPFNKNTLIENAKKFSYIVRVVKLKNGKHSLYNYNVPFDKLIDFITMFKTNELSGTIIDIEKFKPNDLA